MNTRLSLSDSARTMLIPAFLLFACLFFARAAVAEEGEALHEGIPISWWETYFGPDYSSDSNATALADPDGDGANNFLEYATMTHPREAGSFDRRPVRVSTYAGSAQGWRDGSRTEALLNHPRDLAYDPQGRLWFTETGDNTHVPTSNRIRMINEQEQVVTLTGSAAPGLMNGSLAEALFNTPQTPVFDSHGNAYIADVYNHCVRKISVDGVVSTLAGSTIGYLNGPGLQARFYTVQSICIDAADNLYVADWDNICIRKITPDGEVSLYAGQPGIRGSRDGPRLEATFETPDQMAFAPNGNMYLTDWINGSIRMIDTNGMVGTFAHGMTYAHRILVDADSNVYATWGVPGPVTFLRKFRPDATIAWTVGGWDHIGFEDGPIASARFAYAFSPVLRPDGDILISDQLNHRIRRLEMGAAQLLTIMGPRTFHRSASVSLESVTDKAEVRFTLDGTEPTLASPLYTGPFFINATSTTVRAQLFVQETRVSETVSATFTRLDTPGAPEILGQPYDQTVVAGETAVFLVYATEEPLSFQWLFDGEPLPGETRSALSLEDVRQDQAGDYTVIVSNPLGSVTSIVARLTVTPPPTLVRIHSTSVTGGETFALVVQMQSQGTENALGFSLSTEPRLLTILSVSLSAEAPPDASLFVNDSDQLEGRAGVLVSMPPGQTFPAGDYPLLVVQCRAAAISVLNGAGVWFESQPILQQVSDIQAQQLPVDWFNAFVEILPLPPSPLEGDVAPRPVGDRLCTVIDFVQAGRFVALLDTPAPEEFQRVDCAPRTTLGNGTLSVADWVQAGRYAAGLDPLTPVGGPSEPAEVAPSSFASPAAARSGLGEPVRTLSIPDLELGQVSSFTVPVQLQAQGAENAVGFSVAFDPARVRLSGIVRGSSAAGATLHANLGSSASGRAGAVLALPAGSSFSSGRQEIARLQFNLLDLNAGAVSIALIQNPVLTEVVDMNALVQDCSFVGGTIAYEGAVNRPRLGVSRLGKDLILFWPSDQGNFVLQESALANGEWSPSTADPISVGTQTIVIIPAAEPTRFFRLSSFDEAKTGK